MNKTPYDYQEKVFNETISAIESGERRLMINLPTRAGKSIIAAMLTEHFRESGVYFIAHKTILIKQMSEELEDNGIKHGIIAPWAPQLKYRVQVISKDTFYNRFKKMSKTGWKAPGLIVVDEAHMAMGKRYEEILKAFPNSILIGMTATVCRLDGRPFRPLFTHLIKGPSISELQKKNRLCPVDTFVAEFDTSGIRTKNEDFILADVLSKVDKPAVISGLVTHWEKLAKGKKTLSFAASIQHAEDIASQFNDCGYPSIALSSKDDSQTLKFRLNEFYDGKYINLVSVDLFTMGFTVKDCECILQARPTKSLMLYKQALGRGMCWMPGKTLINLDCVANYKYHGLPEDDVEWSLDGKPKKEKEEATLKMCPACFRPLAISARVCHHCGFEFTATDAGCRIPREREGRLVKLSREDNDLVLKVAREASTFDEAKMIAGELAESIWFGSLRETS